MKHVDRDKPGCIVKPGSRGREVMTIVRDLAGSVATGEEIARKAGTSPGRVAEARIVLRFAPDLAELVIVGRIGLFTAYRAARTRRDAPADLRTATHLTVAELARLAHIDTKTLYRHIANGDLETLGQQGVVKIPAQVAREFLAHAGSTRGHHEDLLLPSDAAALLGVHRSKLIRLADKGELSTVRTPGGHRRYRATEILALATNRPLEMNTSQPIRARQLGAPAPKLVTG